MPPMHATLFSGSAAGSTWIRAASKRPDPIGVLASEGVAPQPIKPIRRLRLLLAEDDIVLGMLLGEMLEEMGHEICAIESSEADLVAAALKYGPDLMIVNAELGDGSGVSAVTEILRAGPIAHLFTSGDIARVRILRPDAVLLQKPFRELDLIRAMQRALDRSATAF